ncbi:DNA oxidative demethylase ALKBH2 isoform X1 [Coffea arabica]|uniref:DNA oxidative demethylase ALKBH2 isoform X1 n=1 Tax=Coffea arabica TaxID=13443 RepID=A0A6P6U836_COFAR|nr:DNA oxidative demethylase ALKBH2 isoform X1 [Coffea arabica]
MTTVTNLILKAAAAAENGEEDPGGAVGGCSGTSSSSSRRRSTLDLDLGNGSQVVYVARFLGYQESWDYFHYLNKHIPWTRPTIRVFGRSSVQPRDVCYVASEGLPDLAYSGYQPHAHSWDEFPPLKDILEAVHSALPGSCFNSLLLNRYKGGSDYVSWHADDEKLYGPTHGIASVSFGCEREFLLKRKPGKNFRAGKKRSEGKRAREQDRVAEQHSFTLKHGSLLVMRGYTQRDWLHSVPKRAKAQSTRINLTFRLVPSHAG